MRPRVGEALGSGVVLVDDDEFCFLLFWVGFKVAADEIAIPLPVVFAVGCGVDAYVSAAMVDIVLQGLFFFGAEYLAGGVEEDEGGIFFQDLFTEPGGVGGG